MRELQLKFFCDRWEYPRMRTSAAATDAESRARDDCSL